MKMFKLDELTVEFLQKYAAGLLESVRTEARGEVEDALQGQADDAAAKAVEEAKGLWAVQEKKAVEDAVAAERARCAAIMDSAFDGQDELVVELIEGGVAESDAVKSLIADAKEKDPQRGAMSAVRGTEPTDPPTPGSGTEGGKDAMLNQAKEAARAAGVQVV